MKSYISKLKRIFGEFSLVEKSVFLALSVCFFLSGATLIYLGVDSFRVDAPGQGGTLKEGVIGYPTFINPIFSVSDSGKDLSALLYSGLMKINEKGEVVPDLAESYEISPDGTVYTFTIREDAVFHDGKEITSADVVFTISKVKDTSIKSPLASNWQGVEVRAVDQRTVQMTLRSQYSPFIQNTTLGILPEHIWKDADINQFTFSPYNFEPIGSGPYEVAKLKRSSQGAIEYYELKAFKKYAGGRKNISRIFVYFFKDSADITKALEKGVITSAGGISPSDADNLKNSGFRVETLPLLRTFGVFFNQNQANLFTDKVVRQALNMAINREELVNNVLGGYGTKESSPVSSSITGNEPITGDTEGAKELLEKNGWKPNEDGVMEKKTSEGTKTLTFELTTSNNPDLSKTAELIKEQWLKIGAKVEIKTIEASNLSESVIRPRKYDALLFGEIPGRSGDLFPFWHSSERKDPGLNIALYTNMKADDYLEALRIATSTEQRSSLLSSFAGVVESEVPAIFLYSPEYIYVLPKDLKGVEDLPLEIASERWSVIFASYLKAKRVWK